MKVYRLKYSVPDRSGTDKDTETVKAYSRKGAERELKTRIARRIRNSSEGYFSPEQVEIHKIDLEA